ncbi:MAG: FG-GAP repeat domain-containing protein, partial [Sandaracinaceae bacterium]
MKAPYVPLAVGLTLVSIACGDPSSTDPPAPCSADDECEGAARCVDGRCAPGMASSDAGPVASDAGPADMEACDGFDDDGDDLVDEGCACTVGSTQACRPWREGEAPPCALEGVQACEGAEFGEWGACEVPPPDPASELCPTWILGADVDDQLTAARGAGIGDLDHDGDPELLAPSMRGDGSGTNDGVTYVIGGGPDLQGRTIDLRTDAPEARIQGASFGQEAHLADVDGDGYLDVVRGTGGRAALVAYGDASLPVLLEAVDGTRLARLTGGGASSGEASWMVGDMDGDGRAEVFMSGANSTLHGGTSHGLSYWSGQARSAEIAPSGVVGIEIGTVGVATQANNTNGGGAGDFDADGYLDITANRGAANDGMYIPYVVRVVDGRSSGGWSSMSEGLGVSGGTGFGVWASLQNGDVDGDGTDDLVLLGHGRRHVYVVYGGADLATSLATGSLDAAGFVVHSDELRPDVALGVGDLDGDGADDLVIPLESADADLVIVWGGARRTGELDPIEP